MRRYIGTSGFSYPAWKKGFYPEGLASSQWLTFYSSQFNTLELNNTFYRFPMLKTLRSMYDRTPQDFLFSVKMHKVVTHTLRMKDARTKTEEFMQIVEEGFAEKLGCILFQFPASFRYSDENLENLLATVRPESRNVIEFRDLSWWREDVREALRKNNLTICNVSFPGLPEDHFLTSDRYYHRMHGVPELFKSSYAEEDLRRLEEKIPAAKDQFIYFNNTMFDAGYTNARTLQRLSDDKTNRI